MIQIESGQAIGPFQTQGFLGRGAFSQVFLAVDGQGNHFALKFGDESGGGRYVPRFGEVTSERHPSGISPDETPAEALFLDPFDGARAEVLDTAEVDRLLRAEARLLSAAGGHGVVPIFDVLEMEGRPVLVLDFLAGRTLRERIRSREGVKLRWLLQALRTVEELAARGAWTSHGDLKPENILVTEKEEVFLIDPAPSLGREDLVIATPWYNPFLRRDAKGDAQAMGIMLYELLTGALPFEKVPYRFARTNPEAAGEEERQMTLSFFLGFPQARELNPHTPAAIEQMIHRSLCDEKYGLADLRLDLERFLECR